MNNQVNWLQQGWECPKCGAVMSPTTACCVNCRGSRGVFVTGTSIGDPQPSDNITISTSGPLEPPYVLKKSGYNELWEKVMLNEYKTETKEYPEEQWERYQLNV